jgi:RNA-directed DNA polymerase
MDIKTANGDTLIEQDLSRYRRGNSFHPLNIAECESHVRNIQYQLDKAVANGDKPRTRFLLHYLMMKSRAVKILAVNRVCNINQGKHTAGVDGTATPKEGKHEFMEQMLNTIEMTKEPDPIRRVYIPKPDGGERPLGIPTISDRIVQDIIRQSIEPVCEYHFNHCSHGFRPYRSCHDAIGDLFSKLSRSTSKRWIIEGDIKGCFNTIDHNHISNTLRNWKIPAQIITLIERILKSGIMETYTLTPSLEGTPQGGIISPMLANVALTCLDDEIHKRYGYNWKNESYNPIVRYADDFIIVCKSEKQALQIKEHIKVFLKEKVGLELSTDKTRITHILEGFDFLGFNVKKYPNRNGEILRIVPSKDNVKRLKQKIKQETKTRATADALIMTLNPITRGWAYYYKHVVSSNILGNIGHYMFLRLNKWASYKHSGRGRKWIRRMYFLSDWTFYDKVTGLRLYRIERTKIERHIKVRAEMRVYCQEHEEYWKIRRWTKAKQVLIGKHKALYVKQEGRCGFCNQMMDREMHVHHIKPVKYGGDNKHSNLRLIHSQCHKSLHSLISLSDMATYADKGINYLGLLKVKK